MPQPDKKRDTGRGLTRPTAKVTPIFGETEMMQDPNFVFGDVAPGIQRTQGGAPVDYSFGSMRPTSQNPQADMLAAIAEGAETSFSFMQRLQSRLTDNNKRDLENLSNELRNARNVTYKDADGNVKKEFVTDEEELLQYLEDSKDKTKETKVEQLSNRELLARFNQESKSIRGKSFYFDELKDSVGQKFVPDAFQEYDNAQATALRDILRSNTSAQSKIENIKRLRDQGLSRANQILADTIMLQITTESESAFASVSAAETISQFREKKNAAEAAIQRGDYTQANELLKLNPFEIFEIELTDAQKKMLEDPNLTEEDRNKILSTMDGPTLSRYEAAITFGSLQDELQTTVSVSRAEERSIATAEILNTESANWQDIAQFRNNVERLNSYRRMAGSRAEGTSSTERMELLTKQLLGTDEELTMALSRGMGLGDRFPTVREALNSPGTVPEKIEKAAEALFVIFREAGVYVEEPIRLNSDEFENLQIEELARKYGRVFNREISKTNTFVPLLDEPLIELFATIDAESDPTTLSTEAVNAQENIAANSVGLVLFTGQNPVNQSAISIPLPKDVLQRLKDEGVEIEDVKPGEDNPSLFELIVDEASDLFFTDDEAGEAAADLAALLDIAYQQSGLAVDKDVISKVTEAYGTGLAIFEREKAQATRDAEAAMRTINKAEEKLENFSASDIVKGRLEGGEDDTIGSGIAGARNNDIREYFASSTFGQVSAGVEDAIGFDFITGLERIRFMSDDEAEFARYLENTYDFPGRKNEPEEARRQAYAEDAKNFRRLSELLSNATVTETDDKGNEVTRFKPLTADEYDDLVMAMATLDRYWQSGREKPNRVAKYQAFKDRLLYFANPEARTDIASLRDAGYEDLAVVAYNDLAEDLFVNDGADYARRDSSLVDAATYQAAGIVPNNNLVLPRNLGDARGQVITSILEDVKEDVGTGFGEMNFEEAQDVLSTYSPLFFGLTEDEATGRLEFTAGPLVEYAAISSLRRDGIDNPSERLIQQQSQMLLQNPAKLAAAMFTLTENNSVSINSTAEVTALGTLSLAMASLYNINRTGTAVSGTTQSLGPAANQMASHRRTVTLVVSSFRLPQATPGVGDEERRKARVSTDVIRWNGLRDSLMSGGLTADTDSASQGMRFTVEEATMDIARIAAVDIGITFSDQQNTVKREGIFTGGRIKLNNNGQFVNNDEDLKGITDQGFTLLRQVKRTIDAEANIIMQDSNWWGQSIKGEDDRLLAAQAEAAYREWDRYTAVDRIGRDAQAQYEGAGTATLTPSFSRYNDTNEMSISRGLGLELFRAININNDASITVKYDDIRAIRSGYGSGLYSGRIGTNVNGPPVPIQSHIVTTNSDGVKTVQEQTAFGPNIHEAGNTAWQDSTSHEVRMNTVNDRARAGTYIGGGLTEHLITDRGMYHPRVVESFDSLISHFASQYLETTAKQYQATGTRAVTPFEYSGLVIENLAANRDVLQTALLNELKTTEDTPEGSEVVRLFDGLEVTAANYRRFTNASSTTEFSETESTTREVPYGQQTYDYKFGVINHRYKGSNRTVGTDDEDNAVTMLARGGIGEYIFGRDIKGLDTKWKPGIPNPRLTNNGTYILQYTDANDGNTYSLPIFYHGARPKRIIFQDEEKGEDE